VQDTRARVSWISHVHGPYPYPVIRRGRSNRSSLEGCGTPLRVNRLDSPARGDPGIWQILRERRKTAALTFLPAQLL
jgi:hypothetical protein